MLKAVQTAWRNTPEPPLWRAVLFAVGVIFVLAWPVLRGEAIRPLPATLATLLALALIHDVTRAGWERLRNR